MANFIKKIILKNRIKSFDGSENQLDKIIELVEGTEISLGKRYSRTLSKIRDQIEYNRFISVHSEEEEQRAKKSITELVFSAQKLLKKKK